MKQASGMSDRTSQIILTVICAIVLLIVAWSRFWTAATTSMAGCGSALISSPWMGSRRSSPAPRT